MIMLLAEGRRGDTDFLKACGEKYGFHVEVLQPVGDDGLPYSSTLIRQMIAAGDVSGCCPSAWPPV